MPRIPTGRPGLGESGAPDPMLLAREHQRQPARHAASLSFDFYGHRTRKGPIPQGATRRPPGNMACVKNHARGYRIPPRLTTPRDDALAADGTAPL